MMHYLENEANIMIMKNLLSNPHTSKISHHPMKSNHLLLRKNAEGMSLVNEHLSHLTYLTTTIMTMKMKKLQILLMQMNIVS